MAEARNSMSCALKARARGLVNRRTASRAASAGLSALSSQNSARRRRLSEGRAGLGFSDRSLSGGTAIFSANRRSSTDETTQTQPLTGFQGPSGFGRHQGREDAGAASGAL